MTKADVSVIIPCYRCASTIERCVQSVMSQTLLPKEIILVDDASDDQSEKILDKLQSLYSSSFIRIIKFDINQGPASARNAGWDLSESRFVAFLDADDVWHTNKIKVQYSIIMADDSIDVSSHGTSNQEFDTHAACLEPRIKNVYFKRMLFNNSVPTRSVMLKRNINFRFENGLYYAEDYRLWLDILSEGLNIIHINCVLARSFKNDYGDNGLSSNLSNMESGVQSIYLDLYKDRKLSLMYYLIILLYSKFKFLTRVLLVQLSLFKNLVISLVTNNLK